MKSCNFDCVKGKTVQNERYAHPGQSSNMHSDGEKSAFDAMRMVETNEKSSLCLIRNRGTINTGEPPMHRLSLLHMSVSS